MKWLSICLILLLTVKSNAQTDLIRLWFDADFNDSIHQVTLTPKLLNTSSSPVFYYYQLRLTDATLRPENTNLKLKGSTLALPLDTVTLLSKTLDYKTREDFSVFVYVLNEEYVVAEASWNFDNAYSDLKKLKPKPKAPLAFMAKDDIEIDALIINETRTPFGREFYRKFMEFWQAPKSNSGYWVSIRETLTPGRFTILTVSLNNKELFQRYLIPKPEEIENLAQQTVNYITSLLQNGNYDGSLSNEDLFGKGVE